MAPIKPVRTLYDFSLDEVLDVIYEYIKKAQKNLAPFRKQLIGLLHARIRENLIDRAVSSYNPNVFDLLDILELLADSSTKKLHLKKKDEFLTGFQSGQLYSRIDGSNIIGLHELHVKVQVENTNSPNEPHSSNLLHNALRRGLASNLRVLTLHNAADNQSLKIIGQYAQHLTSLDITSSWLVDDIGIGDLLLKDASNVIKAHLAELEICEPATIEALSGLPKTQINRTCETLQEVRIQDTNTTSISVLLLLMFSSNLKSFGGFLYYRNIGDAVLSVQTREGAPPHLLLTDLWDTQLPPEKLQKIATYLPHLNTLYTRAAWLPSSPGILPPLTNLTADFDFCNFGYTLFPYLAHSGESIRRLILIDQVFSLDISEIGRLCPNLEELTAKVFVQDSSTNIQLKNLHNAKVRMTTCSTFIWIMKHAPTMEQFEILFECEDFDIFGNDVIDLIISENPSSLKSIKHLSVHMFYNVGYQPMEQWRGILTIDAAYALCAACDNLRILGELHTWYRVTSEDINKISKFIKQKNWDVKLSYRDALYPA